MVIYVFASGLKPRNGQHKVNCLFFTKTALKNLIKMFWTKIFLDKRNIVLSVNFTIKCYGSLSLLAWIIDDYDKSVKSKKNFHLSKIIRE